MAAQNRNAPKHIDYQLHKAQQLEILNSSLELLKNNVYGQTQVDIVLFKLSEEGVTLDQAVEFSLEVINKMNEVNLREMNKRKAEIEAKKKEIELQNTVTPPAPNSEEGATA